METLARPGNSVFLRLHFQGLPYYLSAYFRVASRLPLAPTSTWSAKSNDSISSWGFCHLVSFPFRHPFHTDIFIFHVVFCYTIMLPCSDYLVMVFVLFSFQSISFIETTSSRTRYKITHVTNIQFCIFLVSLYKYVVKTGFRSPPSCISPPFVGKEERWATAISSSFWVRQPSGPRRAAGEAASEEFVIRARLWPERVFPASFFHLHMNRVLGENESANGI